MMGHLMPFVRFLRLKMARDTFYLIKCVYIYYGKETYIYIYIYNSNDDDDVDDNHNDDVDSINHIIIFSSSFSSSS